MQSDESIICCFLLFSVFRHKGGQNKTFKGDEEKIHILIYQPFSFSFCCPLFLSLPVITICLSAIFHNPKYLFLLPSNSPSLSWSLYFCYSLFSHRPLSIYLTLWLWLGLVSSPLHQLVIETKDSVFSSRFISRCMAPKPYPNNKYVFARKQNSYST